MKFCIFSTVVLILTVDSASSVDDGFFITAPAVFHLDVNEKVFVQMGKSHLNTVVTLYLEHESSGVLLSQKQTVESAVENEIKIVELMIDTDLFSRLPKYYRRHYFNLVAESPSFSGRKTTKVLLTKHRGYIFIQTNQPVYNPTQTVRYRIFTLDHTFRPHNEVFQISVINAAGNRVMKTLRAAKNGVLQGSFHIPDVSKLGTWKIKAHYEDDEANPVSREFKVQKFVLPSFVVNIKVDPRYILLSDKSLTFIISAKYLDEQNVKGAYHCRIGVVRKGSTHGKKMDPMYIMGLDLTGSVQGETEASVSIEDINVHLQKQHNQTLSEVQQSGAQIYLGVFVTSIQNGEMQMGEVYLPIITHKYTMDLSQTRSYFLPGYPLDVVMVMSLPDGSPAAGVPVTIDVSPSSEASWQGTTNQEGAVFPVFNIPTAAQVTVEVTADDLKHSKVIRPATSPSGSFLYLSITNKIYSVGDTLTMTYNTLNGPADGFIYYMVLSRGILTDKGSLRFGTSVRGNLHITPHMVPSFRLIGYFYNQRGDIIADSVWVDVRDECEINVKVQPEGEFKHKGRPKLEFDLHGQRATVALLAVDKAFYGLKADNKLTAKQVYSSMQSYDIGCSYSGGSDSEDVITGAGLSFVTQSQSNWRKNFVCDSQSARQRRSVDLQQEMMTLKSNFSDEKLQECCVHGFSLIPMRRTCQQRAERVSRVEADPACVEAFLNCCLKGERLRQKKIQKEAEKGFGRTSSTAHIEEFFMDIAAQYIRRYFPPSFAFTEFEVNDKLSYNLVLPDSITTWEIQVMTLSANTGFCVVKPFDVTVEKGVFVSLRLPYSVKKYEQLSISPVIYNYGSDKLHVAVHMEQSEGLCSPGSATSSSFVNITVEPESSQFVSFSAVPMVIGSIPIKIRLYDIENEAGIDAIQKNLNVWTEGLEHREEAIKIIKLDGKRSQTITLDGFLPSDTIPESSANIFVSVEGNGFGSSHAKNLLSPENIATLIVLPTGCLEQTMVRLAPTASAVRYLDLSEQWFDLPAGSRDDALDKIESGYMRILGYKKSDGSYGAWGSVPSSNWVTALVVKVLSLVAQRQIVTFGQQGRRTRVVPMEEIRHPVRHLLSVQKNDGSFSDPQPVIHRGVLKDRDQDASMTAFITLALQRSLEFLDTDERINANASISRSTAYLISHLEEIQHPYAVAITAYCLAVCQRKGTDLSSAWAKLEAMATEDKNGCALWTADASQQHQKRADAITVETTAYALLATVELERNKWADKAACWLTSQENYFGGFKSSQDTIMALEALAEYELKKSISPETNLVAEFSSPVKRNIVKVELENKKQKVEAQLKIFAGNNIILKVTGNGEAKLKVVKAYHLFDPTDVCDKLSISVTVEGKVKYTVKVIENYDYYDDYSDIKEKDTSARSATEELDAHTLNQEDLDSNLNSDETVTYTICVSHSLDRNLTGMAIADITLLSGFEAVTEDLDKLKQPPEQYISHYEVSYGRVLIYFNELFEREECISFSAVQRVPIGLLQPAPAVFYDYYEPDVKCTVFYSAPLRSKMVSRLCSEDVCQCAERPCHKIQNAFQSGGSQKITKTQRSQHACFHPVVDYAYIVEVIKVSMKNNFELYETNVTEVLKSYGDILVSENSIRVFAKRGMCKEQLESGKQYLIMGKDGSTVDSNGMMVYLLESNTWVEKRPSKVECRKSADRTTCAGFNAFIAEYKINGCRQ